MRARITNHDQETEDTTEDARGAWATDHAATGVDVKRGRGC